MPTKKDPASTVVEFFETASLETAVVILNVSRGIVARRQGRTQGVPRLRKGARLEKTESMAVAKVG